MDGFAAFGFGRDGILYYSDGEVLYSNGEALFSGSSIKNIRPAEDGIAFISDGEIVLMSNGSTVSTGITGISDFETVAGDAVGP